jgi:hypothetical protein
MAYTPGSGAVISLSVEGAGPAKKDIESVGESLKRLDQTSFQRLSGQISTVQSQVGGLKTAFTDILQLSVAGFTIGAFTQMIHGAIESADSLNDLRKSTGLTITDLAGLKLAAAQSGTDLAGVAAAVNKLSTNIGKEPEKYRKLGITAKEPIEAFKQLSDIFSKIEDPQQRAAFSAEALGKSWASAAPLLAEGSDSIGKMVEKGAALSHVTQELADNADQFNDKIAEMNAASEGFKMKLAGEMLPVLTQITTAMTQAYTESGKLAAAWVALGGAGAFMFTDEFAPPTTKIKNLREELDRLYEKKQFSATPGGRFLSNLFGTEGEIDRKIDEVRGKIKQLEDDLKPKTPDQKGPSPEQKEIDRLKGQIDAFLKTGKNDPFDGAFSSLGENVAKLEAANKSLAAYRDATEHAKESEVQFDIALGKFKEFSEPHQAQLLAMARRFDDLTVRNKLLTESMSNRTEGMKAERDAALIMASGASAANAYTDALAKLAEGKLAVLKPAEREAYLQNAQNRAIGEGNKALANLVDSHRTGAAAVLADVTALQADAVAAKYSAEQKAKLVIANSQGSASFKEAALAAARYADSINKIADAGKLGVDLKEKSRALNAEMLLDDRARADAQLAIEVSRYQRQIDIAQAAYQELADQQFEYVDESVIAAQDSLERAKQSLSDYVSDAHAKMRFDEFNRSFSSMEATAHDTFVSWANGARDVGTRMRDSLKSIFFDWLYQMTVKKWLINVGATLSGTGIGTAASAADSFTGSAGSSGLGSILGSVAGAGSAFGGTLATGFMNTLAGTGMSAGLEAAGAMIANGAWAQGLGMAAGALGPIALGVGAVVAIAKSLDHSGTYHTGGAASASSAGVSTIRAESLNFAQTRTSADVEKMTAGLAQSIVGILDSTALTFGKTAGYTAATAFADDTSKDGAWGALVISKLGDKLIDWQDTRTSHWAPKEFADGEEGQKQYLAALSASVRTALDGIGLPSWAQKMLDGLGNAPAMEDLAKVVDSINATQSALKAMGEQLVGFSDMSESAVSALMAAAGGIQKLATGASAYYSNFYQDSEKTAAALKSVGDSLAAVGLQMPATRADFRDLVESQMKLGEAGAPAVAVLFQVAQAFADLHPAAEAVVNNLTQINKGYQDQIDDIMKQSMSAAELREIETKGMDASTIALYDRLHALQAEKAAQEAATASIRQAQQSSMDTLKRSVDARRSVAASAYESMSNSMKAQIDGVNANVARLKSLSNSLQDAIGSLRGSNSAQANRQQAQAQLAAFAAAARSTGALPESGQLRSILSAVTADASDQFGSLVDYQRDQARTRASLEDLAGTASTQETIAEQQVNLLQGQLDQAKAAYDAEMKKYDDLLASAQAQIDAVNGVNTSVMSVEAAIAAFNRASVAAGGGTISMPSGSGGSSAPNTSSGWHSTGVGPGGSVVDNFMTSWWEHTDQDYWYNFRKENQTGEFAPKFANGGMHEGGWRIVGENGPELEATGPSRIFNASQTAKLLSGVADGKTREEVAMLRKAVEVQTALLRRIAESTGRHVELVDNNSGGGGPMLVQVVSL